MEPMSCIRKTPTEFTPFEPMFRSFNGRLKPLEREKCSNLCSACSISAAPHWGDRLFRMRLPLTKFPPLAVVRGNPPTMSKNRGQANEQADKKSRKMSKINALGLHDTCLYPSQKRQGSFTRRPMYDRCFFACSSLVSCSPRQHDSVSFFQRSDTVCRKHNQNII